MGAYYGYERISTKEERGLQKFNRQETALKKYAVNHNFRYLRVFKDDASGKDFNRPEWKELDNTDVLHKGDTIVMKDITRFSRQAEDGYQKYMDLLNAGINLVFIDNPTVSSDYINDLLHVADSQKLIAKVSMESMIKLLLLVEFDRAEQERLALIQRTKDGIASSEKKQGRKKGQLDKMTPKLHDDLIKYNHDRTIKATTLMKRYKISRNTLKKYANIIANEENN